MSTAWGSGIVPVCWLENIRVGVAGVVEHGLHAVGVRLPGADRVVVDRGAGGQPDVGAHGQEAGEPLDEVAYDVAGRPAVDGRRGVPVGRAADPVGEGAGDEPVPLDRVRGEDR